MSLKGGELNSSSEEEGDREKVGDKTITLSQDELRVINDLKIKQELHDKKSEEKFPNKVSTSNNIITVQYILKFKLYL